MEEVLQTIYGYLATYGLTEGCCCDCDIGHRSLDSKTYFQFDRQRHGQGKSGKDTR